MKTAFRIVAAILLALVIIGMCCWGVLAAYYSDQGPAALRATLAVLLVLSALGTLTGLAARRWRLQTLAAFAVIFALLLAWWSTIEPSNEREWKTEVAKLTQVTRDGDLVTVHNIRNFDYKSPAEFTPAYYDKTFDLQKLESVDLIASYWAGPAIAHIFVSFGFGNDEYLTVSIERRDELGEAYSTVKGLFRQYELFYVVADERDVIRLRTNYRHDPPEDVYIYRVQGPLENGRRLFVEYLRRIDDLVEQPDFYNSVTSNCAGNIWMNAHVNPGRVAYSWKILLSGHVPEYLYELGLLDTSLPFEELRRRSRINDAAQAAGGAADFSRLIRAELPSTSVL
jgi:hypothetical protein